MSRKTIRCAIYTRKSSDEGLDQSFNSLDAQREAGEACVKSQAHEGWQVIPTLYDDGGYSGGSMDRPALQNLLAAVDAGLIDVVVVYKIDRLTRSLPDFARILERFEAQSVSFVSVTQSFNTTSSMGRLVLNVLLSFAQFEREITGERIRDKIAASKAKGMWMGGNLPLGYDLPAPGSRILRVNEEEAATVRHIFNRYLNLKSVDALKRELSEQGYLSKAWVTRKGRMMGGVPFNRGALFHLLRNPIYLGRIRHWDIVYEGEHDAIISEVLFNKVRKKLNSKRRPRRDYSPHKSPDSPLRGKLFDDTGNALRFAVNIGANGHRYRYFVFALSPNDDESGIPRSLRRITALGIERAIAGLVRRWLPNSGPPLDIPHAVHMMKNGLIVDIPASLECDLKHSLLPDERIVHRNTKFTGISVPLEFHLCGSKHMIIAGTAPQARPDPNLISTLRNAHSMVERVRGMPLIGLAPAMSNDRKILRLAFLAPQLQRDVLAGYQPATLNLKALKQIEIPIDWNKQRDVLGWPAQG